jgi:carbohydrate kinase (thermoresistant glucokinase family)
MTAYVLMGVSGSGKSTIGTRVAQQLTLPFVEGDNYHPAENITKMSSGIALTDAARVLWLERLVTAINALNAGDAIIACSALTQFVRETLRRGLTQPVEFLLLTTNNDLIEHRLSLRGEHFMKATMLGSQLAALQSPSEAHVIDVGRALDVVTADVASYIRSRARQ